MIHILGYLLTPSLETRPDIFQVSFLAFKLAGKKNPVQNLNVSKISKDQIFMSDVVLLLSQYFLVMFVKFSTTFALQKVSEPNFDNISLHSDGPLAANILVPESTARLFEEDLVLASSLEAFFMCGPSE